MNVQIFLKMIVNECENCKKSLVSTYVVVAGFFPPEERKPFYFRKYRTSFFKVLRSF